MSISLMTMAWRLDMPVGRKMVLLALCDSANDQGDCYPSVAVLCSKCSMSERAIQGHVSELEKMGFLSRNLRNGRSTIYKINPRRICTPAESAPPQNLHPTPADSAPTPAESAPPTPAESAPVNVIEPFTEPSGEPPPAPASKKTSMRGVSKSADDDPGFLEFWAAWPVRISRMKAAIAWRQIRPDADLRATIIAAVLRQRDSEDWLRDGGRYIPHAATWLRGRRWEDDLAPTVSAYSPAESAVFDAYNAALTDRGWPEASMSLYSSKRAGAVREFLGFGEKPGWVAAYFGWLAGKLPPLEGFGFDWVISRGTYLRAKEGNFAALREAA